MAYELNGYHRMVTRPHRVEVCPLLDKCALNIYKRLGEVESCKAFRPSIRHEHYRARRRVKSFRICDILGEPDADHRKESDQRHDCYIEPNIQWNQKCTEHIFTAYSKDIYGLNKRNISPLIRPWERSHGERSDHSEFQSPFLTPEKSLDDESNDEIIDVEDDNPVVPMSPLDALAEMSSKTFGGFLGSRTGAKNDLHINDIARKKMVLKGFLENDINAERFCR
ncbi:hypothetical protein CHS0354_006426 [Potamilus streckersoni]|uniref:Uncharacterized protein n=1 Tax=Potamilus streckersoni TaxID=2493646 RepID=A0AAE0W969_9BIVA|nr:hypothetical protein CHS0354_006426 [Potamilus streckersoni]